MKKILFLIAAFSLVASSAFAAPSWPGGSSDTGNGYEVSGSSPAFAVKASKNVFLAYGSGASKTTYVCGSYHGSGTKTFGSSSGDTKIFATDSTGASLPDAPSAASASAAFTWTAL